MNSYVITATVENVLMALQRMTSILARNRMHISHINVIEMQPQGKAHLSFAFQTDQESFEKVIKQFRKIIELLDLKIN